MDAVSDRTDTPSALRPVELLWPAAVALVLFAVKVVYLRATALAPGISDALVYMRNARDLLEHLAYEGTHYPPLYSVAIAPAFLFEDHWTAILVLNAFYSSLVLIPAYLLARLVVGRTPARLVVLVVALIPYHLVFPAQVFSENIYFPLLLLVVYMLVRRPERHPWVWDALTGAVIGALWLSRHVTFALVPAFLAMWWLRELLPAQGTPRPSWRELLGRFALLVGTMALVYAPWLDMQLGYGASLSTALGLGLAAPDSMPDEVRELTIARLLYWIAQYTAYFALLAAPVANLLALGLTRMRRTDWRAAYGRLVAGTGLMALMLGVAITRHSWRVSYNHPDPAKIMGRYVIYFTVFFLILGVAMLVRDRAEGRSLGRFAAVSWIAPAAVLVAAYAIVVGDVLYPVSETFITDRGGVDVFKIELMGPVFVVLVLGLWALVDALLWKKRRDAALWALFGGLVVLSLWGMPQYHEELMRHQVSAAHGIQVAALDTEESLAVVVGPGITEPDGVAGRTNVAVATITAGRRRVVVVPIEKATREVVGDRLVLEIRLLDDAGDIPDDDVLAKYEIEGRRYVIVVSPLDSGSATQE